MDYQIKITRNDPELDGSHLEELIDLWLEEIAETTAPVTAAGYRQKTDHFVQWWRRDRLRRPERDRHRGNGNDPQKAGGHHGAGFLLPGAGRRSGQLRSSEREINPRAGGAAFWARRSVRIDQREQIGHLDTQRAGQPERQRRRNVARLARRHVRQMKRTHTDEIGKRALSEAEIAHTLGV